MVCMITYYSYVHYDTCPITERKRWISLTHDQVLALSVMDQESISEQYKNHFLSENNKLYQKCNKIVTCLIEKNQDLAEVKNISWNLNVIEDEETNNAFVLPNGEIFIFTGMINVLDSEQELAFILGHEMAHAILGHTQVSLL